MSSTAVFEHSFYIGSYISGILYGLDLVMYFATLQKCLFCDKPRRQSDIFFAFYSTVLLIFLTIDTSCNAVWGEILWITSRDMPGGPSAWFAANFNVWYQLLGSVSVVAMIFMGDGLLVYRCFMLWNSNFKVIILPMIIYLAAFSLAIVELVGAFTPGGNFFGGRAVVFGTAYYSLTIGLNIIVTLLICMRLVYLSRLIRSALGDESSRLYTNIATITVESAAPYMLFGIMFLIPYTRKSPTAIFFGQIYAKLACLSPQLIVLRVMTGHAWSEVTVKEAQKSLSLNSETHIQGTVSSTAATGTQFSEERSAETDNKWKTGHQENEA